MLAVVVLAAAGAACARGSAAAPPLVAAESVEYGKPVVVLATLTNDKATGTFTFSRAGAIVCKDVPVQSGAAACTSPQLPVGLYTFVADYSGDASFSPETAEIRVAITRATVPDFHVQTVTAAGGELRPGQPATVSAAGLPTDTTASVVFVDGGVTLCTAAPANGAASCQTTLLPPGQTTVEASFVGDGNYEPASDSIGVATPRRTVTPVATVTPTPTGGHARLFRFSAGGFPADATGVVHFVLGGSRDPLCSQAVVSGAASCIAPVPHSGRARVTAEYDGAGDYGPARSAPVPFTVPRSATRVTLLQPAGALAVAAGTTTRFEAEVQTGDLDAGTPTGTVAFTVAGRGVCSARVLGGVARCSGRVRAGGGIPAAAYRGAPDFLPARATGAALAVATRSHPHTGPGAPEATTAYVPARDAHHVTNTIAASFALLGIAGAGAAAAGAGGGGGGPGGRERHSMKIASTKVKHHKATWEGTARGDASRTYRAPGWSRLDRWSRRLPVRLAPLFPLGARLATDAAYLRAMVGPLALLVPAAGLALGVAIGVHDGGSPYPPTFGLLLALLAVGVFDAVAGFVGAAGFFVAVSVQGAISGTASLRLLLGVCVLWFAVPLIAGAARPLRRSFALEHEWWTRPGDALVASLIGAWAAQKIVGTFSGLAGEKLPILARANTIAVVVLLLVLVRFVLETGCARFYPERLAAVSPERIPFSPTSQRFASLAFRTFLFAFVAYAYLGDSWELWAGTAIFAVPQAIQIHEHRLPNSEQLHRILPGGIVKTVLMMWIGWLAFDVFHRHVSGAHVVSYGFVALAVPATALGLIELFGRDGPPKRDSIVHQAVGVAALVVGVLFVLGVLP